MSGGSPAKRRVLPRRAERSPASTRVEGQAQVGTDNLQLIKGCSGTHDYALNKKIAGRLCQHFEWLCEIQAKMDPDFFLDKRTPDAEADARVDRIMRYVAGTVDRGLVFFSTHDSVCCIVCTTRFKTGVGYITIIMFVIKFITRERMGRWMPRGARILAMW